MHCGLLSTNKQARGDIRETRAPHHRDLQLHSERIETCSLTQQCSQATITMATTTPYAAFTNKLLTQHQRTDMQAVAHRMSPAANTALPTRTGSCAAWSVSCWRLLIISQAFPCGYIIMGILSLAASTSKMQRQASSKNQQQCHAT